ncbi:MAG TPA: BPL-N domain-containing protein [Opitutales bacterium]|nr:BPL-N domain-containing protein [Opitutales bacterium]
MKKYLLSLARFFCLLVLLNSSYLYAQPWKILVYAGPGTDESLAQSTIHGLTPVLVEGYEFELVSAEQLQEALSPQDIAAIIFPGGSSATDCNLALGSNGRGCIVNYVEAGGRVIGFCTGAYLWARVRCFIDAERQLGPYEVPEGQYLFPGTAYGPALRPYDMENRGVSATAAQVHWAQGEQAAEDVQQVPIETFCQYWNGGPIMVPDAPSDQNPFPEIHYAQDLYEALPDEVRDTARPIAATMGLRGDGYYACFGIHPEYDLGAYFRAGQWNPNPRAGWVQLIRSLPSSLSLLYHIDTQVSQYILGVFFLRMRLQVRQGLNPEPSLPGSYGDRS